MQTIDLNGPWSFRKTKENAWQPAEVPGGVHQDLLRNGTIDDPFYRDNEIAQRWIGETDWIYRRSFEVSEALLSETEVMLECDGLDTLATILINGKPVAETDNMHRAWRFDVKALLKRGTNTIQITFRSVIPVGQAGLAKRPLLGVGGYLAINGAQYVRKEPCNYGWDWGPTCLTCGIWRPIRLRGSSIARLSDVHVRQTHARDHVTLTATIAAERLGRAPLRAEVQVLNRDGVCVARQIAPLARGKATCELTITKPALWWPNGMGDQPLYRVTVELRGPRDEALDSWSRRIGLRTLVLIREKDQWGESFVFACNGRRFFAKGANWIPADVFQGRVTNALYRKLLQSSVDAHFNMLRVWGGGIYEQDAFYDLCDELGLCVWQDFMFACQSYPAFDPAFMANVKAEAIDNVTRLRHHAALALYCGNNELEQCRRIGDEGGARMTWAEYSSLFDRLLPSIVRQYDGERAYWPSSEHTPCGDRMDTRNPDSGDGHLWNVWHGKEPFEWYRTAFHRFCSEYGFQSFPEPKTCATFTLPEERNITSYAMEHHQRCQQGNEKIIHYMTSWYRLPVGFENTVWLSQIQQGLAIKYAVEHWRRHMPRCMGSLYWQLNDCWPVASWASIDSLGRWKALHYMARQFYAPVLVSGVEDRAKGEVAVHISSDRPKAARGTLSCRVTSVDGSELEARTMAVTIPADASRKVTTLKLRSLIAAHSERDLMIWLRLLDETGHELSRNFVTFCRPKHMALTDPQIGVAVQRAKDGRFSVTLTARRPALWTWLELSDHEAQYDDNFICLEPGRRTTILVTAPTVTSIAAFKRALSVRSIRDTYQEANG